MKRITIKEFLAEYDTSSGFGRGLIEETHIKKLRKFFNTLPGNDADLSPFQLVQLAEVLIGKKHRITDRESAKTFKKLVDLLGGYEALDTLNVAVRLTEENVVFLEQHAQEAAQLAPMIVSISNNIPPSRRKILFNAAEKMNSPEEVVALFKEFDILSKKEHAIVFFDILSFLNNCPFNSDAVIPLLKEATQISVIKQVLDTLVEINPGLITLPNLIDIVTLKNPTSVNRLMSILAPEQMILDDLFDADATLDQCIWSEDIIKNLNMMNCDIYRYLPTILSADSNGEALKLATTKLITIPLAYDVLSFILKTIFTRTHDAVALVNAVEILHQNKLLEDELLDDVFTASEFSDRVATAVVLFKKERCYNELGKEMIFASPEYAPGLAQFYIQLAKAQRLTNPDPRKAMMRHPHCAALATNVIEYLQRYKLHTTINLIAVCKAELTSDALRNLLELMKKEYLLNQPNLDLLFQRLDLIKTLYSGAKCLAYGGKLNQENFEALLIDPINAVSLAENSRGRSSPSTDNSLQDPGARDFSVIRRNAQLLALGQRGGRFFSPMTPEMMQDFAEKTGKDVTKIQNETLIKIAAYTGNQALEERTEHHIAESTYTSFSR